MRSLPVLVLLFLPLLCGNSSAFYEESEAVIREGKDYALFFAVDDYSAYRNFNNLPDPIASAQKLATELSEMYGFQTEIVRNPTKDQIYRKLQEYRGRTFGRDDQLLVFFSGHGDFDEFEVKGYFLPRSGPRIDLSTLGNIVTKIPCRHTLLAIDACYSGTIDTKIAFKGRFQRPGVTADTERRNLIARKLRNQSRLLLTSGGKERTPSGSSGSPFAKGFLNTLRAGYGSGDGLVTFQDLLARMERVSPLPHYDKLVGHEEGSFVFVAKAEGAPVLPSFFGSILPPSSPSPEELKRSPPNNMIFVEGGTFQMGDQFGDGDDDEKPVHAVKLSDFYLSRTELTVAQFADFIEATGYTTTAEKNGGSYVFGGSYGPKKGITWRDDFAGRNRSSVEYSHPVIHVSWYDAVTYCNWLSGQHGLSPVYLIDETTVTPNWSANGYRLPTEAEWEYAARSGGNKEKWAGISMESELVKFANYSGKEDGYSDTAPVGMLRANNLGLTDMSGNVAEWCWDWYDRDYYRKSPASNPFGPATGSNRVVRGGSWYSFRSSCNTADRFYRKPSYRNQKVGFRLARNSR